MGYFFLTSEQKIRRNNIIMGNKHLMRYLRYWIILFDGTYCIAVGIQRGIYNKFCTYDTISSIVHT